MADEPEEEIDGKRVPKKKYYPFGTPSHTHHAYSVFAHLKAESKSFAIQLATATDIEPEVVVEKRRRIVKKPKKVKGGEQPEDEKEEEVAADEIPDLEGEAPCVLLPCQLVLKQIVEVQAKNKMEKYELEDHYEQLMEELTSAEQDIASSEVRLKSLTEVGNQLESTLEKLSVKVESIEKTKDSLNNERSDANNKIMVIESERQKWNRKLEQAQKALSDAMWRKKKASQGNGSGGGSTTADALTLEVSSIAESHIKQTKASEIALADDIARTSYNSLGRVAVVDYSEKPKETLHLPVYIHQKLLYEPEQGRAQEKSLQFQDAHAKRFYQTLSVKSRLSGSRVGDMVSQSINEMGNTSSSIGSLSPSVMTSPNLKGFTNSMMSSWSGLMAPSSVLTPSTARVGNLLANNSMHGGGSGKISATTMLRKHSKHTNNNQIKLAPMGVSSSTPNLTSAALRNNNPQGGLGMNSMSTFSNNNGTAMNNGNNGNNNNITMTTSSNNLENDDDNDNNGGVNEAGIPGRFASGGSTFSSQLSELKLDPVFYRERSRGTFARGGKVGEVRVADYEPYFDDSAISKHYKIDKDAANINNNNNTGNIVVGRRSSMNSSVASRGKGSGSAGNKKDARRIGLKSRCLTTRHPGMDLFEDSMSIQ